MYFELNINYLYWIINISFNIAILYSISVIPYIDFMYDFFTYSLFLLNQSIYFKFIFSN